MKTRVRERARNSYIPDHEHPAGGRLLAGHELITKAPDPRTAVPCGLGGRRRAGTAARNRRARRPAAGGPVDYADGGIGCREPGGSSTGEGAARLYGRGRSSSMSRMLPASSGHIGRGHRFVALGHVGGSPRLDLEVGAAGDPCCRPARRISSHSKPRRAGRGGPADHWVSLCPGLPR